MWAAGAVTPSRKNSFVLRATPRPGGTSREVSYSVLPYHTRLEEKCKVLFPYFFTTGKGAPSGTPLKFILHPLKDRQLAKNCIRTPYSNFLR